MGINFQYQGRGRENNLRALKIGFALVSALVIAFGVGLQCIMADANDVRAVTTAALPLDTQSGDQNSTSDSNSQQPNLTVEAPVTSGEVISVPVSRNNVPISSTAVRTLASPRVTPAVSPTASRPASSPAVVSPAPSPAATSRPPSININPAPAPASSPTPVPTPVPAPVPSNTPPVPSPTLASVKNVQFEGMNYQSQWFLYDPVYTSDKILERDFAYFKENGIKYISISLMWYRLEGNKQGDYSGKDYGNAFLENIKRVIRIGSKYGIQTMVCIHTLWGEDSPWCTPDYVIDPVSGTNQGMAIVRSPEMRKAFLNMFTNTVNYLKGTPGIWCWTINEPWYYPKNLPGTFKDINQKENFITLFQDMNKIVKDLDGRAFTVRFPSVNDGGSCAFDIFEDNWNWDARIFKTLDFVTFTTYLPKNQALANDWKTISSNNIKGCSQRGAKVWISEFGTDSTGQAGTQAYNLMLDHFKTLPLEGVFPWMWRSDSTAPNPDVPGTGFNICASAATGAGNSMFDIYLSKMKGS